MISRKQFCQRGHRYLALLLSAVSASATSTPIKAQPQIPLLSQSPTSATPNPSGTQQSRQAFGGQLAVLLGHRDVITSTEFSPDGRYILTSSGDRTVRLWNRQGKLLAVLRGHEGAVLSAVFSPDGRQILTASFDQTARLWDVSTAIALHDRKMN